MSKKKFCESDDDLSHSLELAAVDYWLSNRGTS